MYLLTGDDMYKNYKGEFREMRVNYQVNRELRVLYYYFLKQKDMRQDIMKKQNIKNIIEFEMNLYRELEDDEGRMGLYKEMDYVGEGELILEGSQELSVFYFFPNF